jgi:hypothetical protein
MKARTSVFIIFIVAVFVLVTVPQGYSAQTSSALERAQQNQPGNNPDYNNDLSGSQNGQPGMTNEAGSQGERPDFGRPLQPTVVKHIGWSWMLISGLIGFVLGRLTTGRRRPYGRDEDIRRNRVA